EEQRNIIARKASYTKKTIEEKYKGTGMKGGASMMTGEEEDVGMSHISAPLFAKRTAHVSLDNLDKVEEMVERLQAEHREKEAKQSNNNNNRKITVRAPKMNFARWLKRKEELQNQEQGKKLVMSPRTQAKSGEKAKSTQPT